MKIRGVFAERPFDMNMRVSVFVYLYRHLILGVSASEAYRSVTPIWQTNETWQRFIENTIVALK